MTRARIRTSALALLLAASCAAPGARSHGEVGAVEAAVRARLGEFLEAQRALAAEQLVGFLAPDFSMFQDGARVDYAGTALQIRATMPQLEALEPRFVDVEVLVLAPDAAVTSMTFLDEIVAADGTVTRSRGPSTLVWRKVDGRWLIVFADSDHYPVEEPPEASGDSQR